MVLTLLLYGFLVFAHGPVQTTDFVNTSVKPTITAREQDESNFLNLAKINMEQAILSARQVSDGKLIESSLEKRNDFLVYRVAFSECNKRFVRVFIDAGSGAFLEKETIQH